MALPAYWLLLSLARRCQYTLVVRNPRPEPHLVNSIPFLQKRRKSRGSK